MAEQSQNPYAGTFPIGRPDRVGEQNWQGSPSTMATNQKGVYAQLAERGTNGGGYDAMEGRTWGYLSEQAPA